MFSVKPVTTCFMKTLTYPDQYYSSLMHKGLTPLFYDRASSPYGNSINSVSMCENNDRFILRVLVPGLNKKELTIQINGSTLTISSNLAVANEDSFLSRLRNFSYSYQLPSDADADRISAKCRDGILTVQIPKLKATVARKTIPVKGSENVTLKTSPFMKIWNQIKVNANFSEWANFKNPVRALGSSAN